MAIASQKISNHPLFAQITRTADIVGFDVNGVGKTCNIRVTLRYADGDTDVTEQFPQRVFTIVADNSTTVVLRNADGSPLLDKDGNEQEIPAYDYVEMLMNSEVQISNVLAFFVQLNDGYNFFNA